MQILNNRHEYKTMYNKMKLLKTCKKERDLTAGKPFYIKTTRVTDTRSYG
jgi:hypothetical protein